MKLTDDAMLHLADILAARVVEQYAAEHKLSNNEAAHYFMGTKTYRLLFEPQSYLALESAEYILDMLDAEEKNDKERWMTI
jgi:hypothetical protein